MKILSPQKVWVIYNPLKMQENVGFWRVLMVSRSKSSWSPPTFQRFSPEFWQQRHEVPKISLPNRSFPKKTKPQLDQCEISWKKLRENHFRLNFQLQLKEFSVTCSQPKSWKKTAALLPRLESFCFSNSLTYRSCQLTHIVHLHVIRDFLQICSFTMAELRWKGCWCVKIVWMIKKAYFRFRWTWTPEM